MVASFFDVDVRHDPEVDVHFLIPIYGPHEDFLEGA